MHSGYDHVSEKPPKERRFSVIFRHEDVTKHCAGIEGLATSRTDGLLFSGSRDATIKRWDVSGKEPAFSASLRGHCDWVNDVLLTQGVLASASADTTIKLWQSDADASRAEFATLQKHSDSVTALAAPSHGPLLVSAGLRGQVCLWDLNRCVPTSSRQAAPSAPVSVGKGKGSCYAVACDPRGTLVAVGSTDSHVRTYDSRSQQKIMKLRGHTDNIRALLLASDGRHMLSASSDHSIKLWDLGQQRCVQTLTIHTDSVWALAATPDFSTVYSGGRDRRICCTHLAARHSEWIAMETAPVRSLALVSDVSGGTDTLWAATTDSTLRCWRITQAQMRSAATRRASVRGARSGSNIIAPPRSSRVSYDERTQRPLVPAPCAVLPGAPTAAQCAVLNDRQRVLLRYTDGEVVLWDVVRGLRVRSFGHGAKFEDVLRELFWPVAVPAWFTADTRLGVLSMHLDPPQCFTAEVYARALGYENVNDERKLNLGHRLLLGVLEQWVHRAKARAQRAPMERLPGDGMGDVVVGARTEPFKFCTGWTPLVASTSASGEPWCLSASQFSGAEAHDTVVPPWVVDAVLHETFPPPAVKALKCAFVLAPDRDSRLPELAQARLAAPCILEVRKVATYCLTKLEQSGVMMRLWELKLSAPPDEQAPPASAGEGPFLELTCNGIAVPFDITLATVRQFIWKRSGNDIVFHFRVMDPSNLAPRAESLLFGAAPPPPSTPQT